MPSEFSQAFPGPRRPGAAQPSEGGPQSVATEKSEGRRRSQAERLQVHRVCPLSLRPPESHLLTLCIWWAMSACRSPGSPQGKVLSKDHPPSASESSLFSRAQLHSPQHRHLPCQAVKREKRLCAPSEVPARSTPQRLALCSRTRPPRCHQHLPARGQTPPCAPRQPWK